MTVSAVYCFVSKEGIPKMKIGRETLYSKTHVDVAKGLIKKEEPQYYTYAEAMEKYNRGSGVIPWQSYPKMTDKRYMKNGRSDTPCS